MAVSEMVIADPDFWKTRKSIHRLDHCGEQGPRSVQIAGSDATMLAHAARLNQEMGAQIIDINMGCPAKKVCKRAAGSALMKDEQLVADILNEVTRAVTIPVTLKMRTGWDTSHRNALTIAQIAEQSGIAALAIHGRTRACGYFGNAEYDTIAEVKSRVSIPVLANGDIDTPVKAKQVLEYTGADGLLIGRAAQGRPWIFREINYFLDTNELLPPVSKSAVAEIILGHVRALHQFYGDLMGLRIARKHTGWYLKQSGSNPEFIKNFNQLESTTQQLEYLAGYFEQVDNLKEIAA